MVPRIQERPLTTAFRPVGEEQKSNRPEVPSLEVAAHPSVEGVRHAMGPEPASIAATVGKPFQSTSTYHPRNISPLRKTHVRSKSSATSLSAPQMTRAHSLPGSESEECMLAPSVMHRSASPLGLSGRRRSPLRRSSDEQYLSCGEQVDIDETISENSELHLTPRTPSSLEAVPSSPSFPSFSAHMTFPRVRRRPSSPFHPGAGTQSISRTAAPTSFLRPSNSSPSLSAIKFNEPYPSYCSLSSSSVPSTPTSLRSRSPSISSLETIPDSPDAEWEAENIAQLKAAADKENEAEGEGQDGARRRGIADTMARPEATRDKGKRWSVCGAERRGDLDLETIWED